MFGKRATKKLPFSFFLHPRITALPAQALELDVVPGLRRVQPRTVQKRQNIQLRMTSQAQVQNCQDDRDHLFSGAQDQLRLWMSRPQLRINRDQYSSGCPGPSSGLTGTSTVLDVQAPAQALELDVTQG